MSFAKPLFEFCRKIPAHPELFFIDQHDIVVTIQPGCAGHCHFNIDNGGLMYPYKLLRIQFYRKCFKGFLV